MVDGKLGVDMSENKLEFRTRCSTIIIDYDRECGYAQDNQACGKYNEDP